MGETRRSDGAAELLTDGAAELMSRREAGALLGELAGLDRETARRVLDAGLAGEGMRLRGTVLHERARVAELAARPCLEDLPLGRDSLPEACQRGTFVARLGPRRPDSSAAGPWRVSALARVRLRATMEAQGFVPFVATRGGYVVLGGDAVGTETGEDGTRFLLREPGRWYAAWRDGRLPASPGPPWQVWPSGLWQM
ncbi:hypothetical protein [Nocardioides solisilvae]|uniref:hypothetical protein n=1 Tax=Nocardioides solisilvae TaxID=1542435 RepID=UPI0013A588C5|nr:hypothetical protein [Nocardioides solisilvae]